MVSAKGKYALRVMVDIASLYDKNEVISLNNIANREKMPIKYLEQVISILVKANLLQSIRGNNGGYKLTKNPRQYSIYEILNATEVSVIPVLNIDDDQTMSASIKPFFAEYNKLVEEYLKKYTLEMLIDDYKNSLNQFDYYI